jgi:probable rRNA maturation factor
VTLTITNRQRKTPVDLPRLRRLVSLALPACLATPGPDETPLLADLDPVEVSILSACAMARVHRKFLALPGPTDVITFPYGEILVCAAVAATQAADHATTPDDELALYVIHGLLHLNGYDDLTPAAAHRMHDRQVNILNTARDKL